MKGHLDYICASKFRIKFMATATKKKESKSTAAITYGKADYIKWHREMLLMRRFEEKCGHLYIQQKFGGFCHF